MNPSPAELALFASWIATAIGFGLWLWSWFRTRDPIARLRFQDCGVVLVFAGVLTRVVTQDRVMTIFDWAMLLLGPLFIAAALWRLSRTQNLPKS